MEGPKMSDGGFCHYCRRSDCICAKSFATGKRPDYLDRPINQRGYMGSRGQFDAGDEDHPEESQTYTLHVLEEIMAAFDVLRRYESGEFSRPSPVMARLAITTIRRSLTELEKYYRWKSTEDLTLPVNPRGWSTVCMCCGCLPRSKKCSFNCVCHDSV